MLPNCNTLSGGEQLLLLGEQYYLLLVQECSGKNMVIVEDKRIVIRYVSDSNNSLVGLIQRWYRETARQVIKERLNYYKSKMGVDYNDFRIKEQKTRWGSCSGRGNLNFNWRLVMAPMKIIDYVVVHELAHLKHMNHSKQFWALVEKQLPEYKELRTWLKLNGNKLVFCGK